MNSKHSEINSKHSKVKTIRLLLGLTQREVAEKAGISQAYLSHVERGNREMMVSTLCRISEAIGVPAAELLPDQKGKRTQTKKAPVNKNG